MTRDPSQDPVRDGDTVGHGEGNTETVEPKAMELLVSLAARSRRVVTKDELMDRLWGDAHIAEGALKHLVWQLRQALGDDARSPRYIETVHRRGYRLLEAPVPMAAEARGSQSAVAESDMSEPPDGELRPATRSEIGAAPTLSLAARIALVLVPTLLILGGLTVWLTWGVGERTDAGIDAVLRLQSDRPAKAVPLTSFPGNEIDPGVSASGDHVVFAWDGEEQEGDEVGEPASGEPPRNFDVWVLPTAGGEPWPVTSERGNEVRPRFSPDGKTVAFLRQDPETGEWGVFASPWLGGEAQRIVGAEIGWPQSLAWSPTGSWLVVSTRLPGESAFRLVRISYLNGGLQPLTDPQPPVLGDLDPAFSPEGSRIAFRRVFGPTVEDVYVLDLDLEGSPFRAEPRRVTFDRTALLGVTWTADGGSLVFSSDRVPPRGLWRVPAAGGSPRWLALPGDFVADPAISSESNALVYQVMHCDSDLLTLDLPVARGAESAQNGTGEASPARPIAATQSTRQEHLPRFSPDGSRIAFLSDRSGSLEIWVVGTEEAEETEERRPRQVTSVEGPAIHSFAWSPNGEWLAFDVRQGEHSGIFLTRAVGGAVEGFSPEGIDESAPSWSRDGRWIYFSSPREGEWQIWRREVETTGQHDDRGDDRGDDRKLQRLTRDGGIVGQEGPDGYLYVSRRGESGIWRQPLRNGSDASGNAERVVEHLVPADFLSWEASDTGLYFVERQRGIPPRVSRFDYATGEVSPVAPLKSHLPYPPGLAVSPDGHRLIQVSLEVAASDLLWAKDLP